MQLILRPQETPGVKPSRDTNLLTYDKAPLSPAIESRDQSNEYWVKEKISYAAGYGNERLPAYLLIPQERARTIPGCDLFSWIICDRFAW
jgi:hypothetical protein